MDDQIYSIDNIPSVYFLSFQQLILVNRNLSAIFLALEFHFLYLIQIMQKNKKSLAPFRRDSRPTGHGGALNRKTPMKISQERGISIQKSSCVSIETDNPDKGIKYQQKYRNQNLSTLPMQLLVVFAGMTTVDLSYNNLADSNIQLVMSSCTKLTTLCIQGNKTQLIPNTILKLTNLVNFKHDWVKLYPKDNYQTAERLKKIFLTSKNTKGLFKINKVLGIDFFAYVQNVMEVPIDKNLTQRIEKCQGSNFAKENMLKVVDQFSKGFYKQRQKLQCITESEQRSLIPGCFIFSNKQQVKPKIERRIQMPHKQQAFLKQSQSQTQTDTLSAHIIIEDIRDIQKGQELRVKNEQRQAYCCLGVPLHSLFANFDKNPYAPAQIDGLLLGGYNPNAYDQNGLSPYHLIIIYRQKKALQHLLEISSKNPGFFDLEIISIKQSRNILHYSVFLKNYQFTKMLIDFGLPVDKRDSSGSRIIHLVDQNYQFLLLLRKLLRKRSEGARNITGLAVTHFAAQNKKFYVKHPQRQKDECKLKIVTAQLDSLRMYQEAFGLKYR